MRPSLSWIWITAILLLLEGMGGGTLKNEELLEE